MKFQTIALATALALTSTFALAQSSGGAAGGSSTSGAPAASGTNSGGAMTNTTGPTGRPSGDAAMQNNQGTTGTGRSPSAADDASTSGAGTAAGPNNTGPRTEPGAVQSGTNGR